MKKIISFITSAVTAFTMVCTPTAAAEKQTTSGISFDDIGSTIENFAEENEKSYASFAVSVYNEDDVLYSRHFGYTDRENKIAADENSVYEWGSISKLFIWVSVMQLYEQGKIDPDADIKNYLPDGFLTRLEYDEPVTMTNLMNHDAGWEDVYFGAAAENESKLISLEEALKNTEPEQIFRPGEITAYSNWGSALAAYIVERVSGMDYADYVHKNILEPLGMKDTAVSADYRDNLSVRERREKSKAYNIMYYPEYGIETDEALGTAMNFIQLYPSGSATGTLNDITLFAQALVSDACPLFENQSTLELMLSASDFYGDTDIPRNCHGLWCTEYAVTTMGHGGNTNAGSANLVFDKESKTGIVVLTNQQNEGVFCYELPKLIFGSFEDNPICKNGNITERNDISGAYTETRSFFTGPLKIGSVLSYQPLEASESPDVYTSSGVTAMERFSDNFFLIPDSDMFYHSSVTKDGQTILENSTQTLLCDNKVKYEFSAVVIYAAISVVILILLAIKGIKKLLKKYRPVTAGKAILTGQLAGLVSAVSFFVLLSAEISLASVVITGVIETVCAIICAVSAVFILKGMITEKNMKLSSRIKYICPILCNIFFSGFIVYFELYQFTAYI